MVNTNDYLAIEEKFYSLLSKKINNLSLYCVTGSLARNSVIPNWSDIDILIGVRDYNENTLKLLAEAIDEMRSPIKIGVSIYSNTELQSEAAIDTKTIHSIRSIMSGDFRPRLLSNDLRLKAARTALVIERDSAVQAELMHTVKRCLEDRDPSNERELYKSIVTIIKILGRRFNNDFSVSSYDDVVVLADKMMLQSSIKFFNPDVIVSSSISYEARLDVYNQIFKWFIKHGDRR